jgi:inorganic pyrophosphatase
VKKKLGPFTFVIDRPKGTVKEWPGGKKFTYPCDYGYWPKIKGEDGEGLDAFVGDDEAGHLESFQKLHPDGTPDETKFLLGVDDKQRGTIYGLYKNEVNARRVYRDWEEVEGAIEKFQTKMHKTSAHAHKWSVGYLRVQRTRLP